MIHENLRMGAYTAPKSSYDETLAKVYEMFPICPTAPTRPRGCSAAVSSRCSRSAGR